MAGASFPRVRLYQSDGTTLVYEFENVLNWNNSPFIDVITFSLHESLRGQGGIVSEGATAPWDFTMQFLLTGVDYKNLVSQMNSLQSTILNNTKYVLRIDLDEVGTTKDLKVKRLSPILFPVTNTKKKVVTFQEGTITFRVDVWA